MPARAAETGRRSRAAPIVDVTMRIEEGAQYFVNRITFTGNTTTRDNVIRREMRLLEGSVFNTEALKYSVRRLNQLGYFKTLEGNEQGHEGREDAGRRTAVDVTLKLEEQNRNQLTFGAGVSQFEGFFGQLAFQTVELHGPRREPDRCRCRPATRAQNYQLAFTEPFLFDRNITGGFDVYKRSLQYVGYYTQKSTGGNLTFGFPVGRLQPHVHQLRYETMRSAISTRRSSTVVPAVGHGLLDHLLASDLSQLTPTQVDMLRRNPFVYDSLLIGQGGERIDQQGHARASSTTRWTTRSSRPPGKRLTASIDLAVLGGNTQFYKPRVEGIVFMRADQPDVARACAAQVEYISTRRRH